MTEHKHTPGPWEVTIGDHGQSWGGYWQIDGKLDAVACNQYCMAGAVDATVSMANAHLIAAAPDLLAALIVANKLLGDIPAAKNNPKVAMSVHVSRAAIAKATGQ